MNRFSFAASMLGVALALQPMPVDTNVCIDSGFAERKPARPAGKAEILFESRQQRRARARGK